MDFNLSVEHQQVRDLARRFCNNEIRPLVNEAEETETFPVEIFRKWGEIGLFGLRYPEADGGAGMDKVADCIVREEISAVSQSFATSWSAHCHLALWPIWRAGTVESTGRRASSSSTTCTSSAPRSGGSMVAAAAGNEWQCGKLTLGKSRRRRGRVSAFTRCPPDHETARRLAHATRHSVAA